MRLRDGVVGGVACGRVEEGEKGADEEGCGVDCQEEGFESGGEERGGGAGWGLRHAGGLTRLWRGAC